MTHLSDDQIVDVLFEETVSEAARQHMGTCGDCQKRLETIRLGLDAAQRARPSDLPMDLPLTAGFYRRKRSRWLWMAAAACFVFLSLLGFRFEVSDGGFQLGFALIGSHPETPKVQQLEQQLAETQAQLLASIQSQAALVESRVDQRFDAMYAEQQQVMRELSQQVEENIRFIDYNNGTMIASLRDDVYSYLQSERMKGGLQ